MAIFKNSTFGTMRKSIGDDVAYRMGGQNIVRKKPAYVNDAKTGRQLARRDALTQIVAIYRSLSSLVKRTFPERASKHSPFNVFSSVNLKNAFSFSNDSASISFPRLLISKGSLPVPVGNSVTKDANGNLITSFTHLMDNVNLFKSDYLAIVGIDQKGVQPHYQRFYKLDSSMPSSITNIKFDKGTTVSFYAYHVSATGHKTSDSLYLGEVKY